jgi:hypothetical protein
MNKKNATIINQMIKKTLIKRTRYEPIWNIKNLILNDKTEEKLKTKKKNLLNQVNSQTR